MQEFRSEPVTKRIEHIQKLQKINNEMQKLSILLENHQKTEEEVFQNLLVLSAFQTPEDDTHPDHPSTSFDLNSNQELYPSNIKRITVRDFVPFRNRSVNQQKQTENQSYNHKQFKVVDYKQFNAVDQTPPTQLPAPYLSQSQINRANLTGEQLQETLQAKETVPVKSIKKNMTQMRSQKKITETHESTDVTHPRHESKKKPNKLKKIAQIHEKVGVVPNRDHKIESVFSLHTEINKKIAALRLEKNHCHFEENYYSSSIKISELDILELTSQLQSQKVRTLEMELFQSIVKFLSQFYQYPFQKEKPFREAESIKMLIENPIQLFYCINMVPQLLKKRPIVSQKAYQQFLVSKQSLEQPQKSQQIPSNSNIYTFFNRFHQYIQFLLSNKIIHLKKARRHLQTNPQQFLPQSGAALQQIRDTLNKRIIALLPQYKRGNSEAIYQNTAKKSIRLKKL